MPAIFISHSSVDRQVSGDVKAALDRLGFEHSFLDFDKVTGLDIGENWEKRLYEELSRCHAAVLVLTPAWLASKWCFAELTQARALGKVILPLLCEKLEGRPVLPDIQSVDLIDWNAGGLERLEQRLQAITNELARGFTLDPTRPPYPGINAFQKEDAAIYFGRDEESRAVLERLDARRTQGGARFVVIIGASGSGKSSLLKASVLPLLNRRRAQWVILPDIRPEKAPTEALAKALAQQVGKPETWRDWHATLSGPDGVAALERFVQDARIGEARAATVLLPIDQFEECFTTTPAAERAAFLGLLQATFARDLPFMVIATGRSDVLEGLIESSELVGHYETFPLTAMPIERYPRLIEGPAAVAGIIVEKGLSERISRDVESKEALPLLAHMLALLYQRGGEDKKLSLAEYELLGDPARGLTPIQNSIRLAADEAIARLKPNERELGALRDAFVPHLVRVRLDDGKRVRQTARRSELPPEALRLIGALTEARLLMTRTGEAGQEREPLVEVTHESLFKAWPTLDQWLTEEQAFLTDLERIRAAHENWAKAPDDQKSGELLYGLLLSRARDWLLKYPQRFISREMEPLRAFIAASAEVADAAKAREAEREVRARQTQRRLTIGAFVVAGVMLLITAGAGIFYFRAKSAEAAATAASEQASREAKSADEARARAEEQRNKALLGQSRLLTRLARDQFNKHDYGTALALTLEALPDTQRGIVRPYLPDTESLLYETVLRLRELRTIEGASRGNYAPDGRQLITYEFNKHSVQIRDAKTGAMIAELKEDSCGFLSATFSPDGQQIATTCSGGTVSIWKAADGTRIHLLRGHDAHSRSAAFSQDGRRIVSSSSDGTVRIWDAIKGGPAIKILPVQDEPVLQAMFSPDNDHVVTIAQSGTGRIWDVNAKDGSEVREISKFENAVQTDGRRLVTSATSDGEVRIWDVEHNADLDKFQIESRVSNPTVPPTVTPPAGKRVAAARDDMLWIWHETPSQTIQLKLSGELAFLTLSRDGERVGAWLLDGTLQIFDSAAGELVASFSLGPLGGNPTHAPSDFSPDNRRIVGPSSRGLTIWDATEGGPAPVLHGHNGPIRSAAFSPDGRRVVTASDDKTLRLWDAESGALLSTHAYAQPLHSAAFLPNGRHIIGASEDGKVLLWDADAPADATPLVLAEQQGAILALAVLRDQKRFGAAWKDGTTRIWDAPSNTPIVSGKHPMPMDSVGFLADGSRVVAVFDRKPWIWDGVNGSPWKRFGSEEDYVDQVSVSADGKQIITSAGSGRRSRRSRQVWDAATLEPWTGASPSASDSSEGRWDLATADGGWVLTSRPQPMIVGPESKPPAELGEPVVVPLEGTSDVASAAFSPDRQRFVTVAKGSTARVWPTFANTQALIDHARAVMPRQLTDQQRKDFFFDAPAGGVAVSDVPAK